MYRRVFTNAKFRRLFAGRVISNVGDSVYYIAAMWLVYDLTNDPFYSGVAGFLTLAPRALQFLTGPLVDRWSIRRILFGIQSAQGLVVLVIPAAHYFGMLSVELILVVMPILSFLNLINYPAQSAALPRIMDDEELVTANSLFSLSLQGIQVTANGVAGLLIAALGAVSMFTLDAVTFAVSAALFVTVYVPPADDAEDDEDSGMDLQSYKKMLREGTSFVYGTFLMWLLVGSLLANFTSGILFAALPAYASGVNTGNLPSVFGGVGAYGVLMGAFSLGSLIGALVADRFKEAPLGKLLLAGFVATSACWAMALLADMLLLTALFITMALIPVSITNVQIATVLQSAPPERLVGRVSSLKDSVSAAFVPVGSLVGGSIASTFTPETALWMFLFGPLMYMAIVLSRRDLRTLPEAHRVSLETEETSQGSAQLNVDADVDD